MTYRRQCEKWDCKHWKTGCNCLSYPGLWHFIPIANSCNSHLQREIKRALQQVLTWHFGFVALSSFCIYFKEALAALLTLPLSACVTPMKISSSLHICFNYNKYTLKIFQSRTINSVFMAEGTAASSSELGIWFTGRRCCRGCCRAVLSWGFGLWAGDVAGDVAGLLHGKSTHSVTRHCNCSQVWRAWEVTLA